MHNNTQQCFRSYVCASSTINQHVSMVLVLLCPLQTAQLWEEQGYVDPKSMAVLPEDEETLSKVGLTNGLN